MVDAPNQRPSQVVLGCFAVHGEVYALDVGFVREVIRWQPATPLPKAPTLIEGVVELRDAVIPVVDLGAALRGKRLEPAASTRIVVAEAYGLVLGLVVDAAVDVLTIESSALGDPPGLAVRAGYDAVRAVVRRPDGAPILVLSLDHLLESVYRSALRGEEAVA